MKAIRSILLSLCLLFSAGCETLGLATPETFNQKLAAGYASVTQVRATATVLLKARKLSVPDAENVLKQTDNARDALDLARIISKSDQKGADAKLASVRTGLIALQTYLASKQ